MHREGDHLYSDLEPSRKTYQRGCHCDRCRKANATYKAGLQAAHKARTEVATQANGGRPIPSLAHGEPKTASWYGCRCSECKGALRQQKIISSLVRQLREEDNG